MKLVAAPTTARAYRIIHVLRGSRMLTSFPALSLCKPISALLFILVLGQLRSLLANYRDSKDSMIPVVHYWMVPLYEVMFSKVLLVARIENRFSTKTTPIFHSLKFFYEQSETRNHRQCLQQYRDSISPPEVSRTSKRCGTSKRTQVSRLSQNSTWK